MRQLVRSLIGAVLTVSFATSAVTWGSMPGCSPVQSGEAHAGQHHPPVHPGQGKLPASSQCIVHLCCLQLVSAAARNAALERLTLADGAAQPALAASFVPVRPPHSLPFAHAPPLAVV